MKNKGYEINYAAKEIIITKRFAKLAQDFTSEESRTMETLLTKYPNFTMKYKEIDRKENKETYSGLSLAVMNAFFDSRIRMAETDEEKAIAQKELDTFKNVKEVVGTKNYAKIKKWFIDNFRDEYKAWSITTEYNLHVEKKVA